MQINPTNLNLTIPIRFDGEGKPTTYAYHMPISREVFEANYRLIGGTLAMLQSKSVGTNVVDVATLALKDIGRRDAREWGLPEGLDVESGGMAVPLLAELKRLTQVIAPTTGGFTPMPVDVALSTRVIDAADWAEAEAALVYFTAGYSTKRRNLPIVAADLALPLLGSITSLPPMEWAASLQTSTEAAPISQPPAAETAEPEVPQ
jgi:hypothetical protein